MAVDKLQASRFELKYFVTKEVAEQIRDFVCCLLDRDEYCVGQPNFSYPVHSLYLDTHDLQMFWATINGNRNRFKLRARFYSTNPDAPVFFELKYRINNCIKKQRGGVVGRAAMDAVFAGQMPKRQAIVGRDPKHVFALMRFCELVRELDARPKAHVTYQREAYVPHDNNSVRLTMDSQVYIEPQFSTPLRTIMVDPIEVWPRGVTEANTVVELKFTNRFPRWLGDLVRRFNLVQCGAAKYADGVERMRSKGISLYGSRMDDDQRILLSKARFEDLIAKHCNEF